MQPPLLILGASARAAAQSAVRGGYAPLGIDFFADTDLQACGQAIVVKSYAELIQAAELAAPGNAIYLGGLENHPHALARIAARHALLGIQGEALAAARDPIRWTRAIAAAKLPHVAVSKTRPTDVAGWMEKPLRSIAGKGVRPAPFATGSDAEVIYQRFQPGDAQSGLFLADRTGCRLLGVTRQLLGPEWDGEESFTYCGSIGPIIDAPLAAWQRLGDVLRDACALTGLFGIDAVVDGDAVFPVEVNPRYTASAELIEQATGASLVAAHVAACQGEWFPDLADAETPMRGKLIVRTARGGVVGQEFLRRIATQNETPDLPAVADIPALGTAVPAGGPLVTCFASGESPAEVARGLRERADALQAALDTHGPSPSGRRWP